MSMTIQPGVKDKILATSSETPRVENAPAEMLCDMDQQMEGGQMMVSTLWIKLYSEYEYEICYHPGMILASQSEAFKQENVFAEGLHGLDQQMERKEDESLYFMDHNSKEWNSGDDQLRLRWMIYLVVLADAAESVRDAIGFEYCLASSSGWTKRKPLEFEVGDRVLLKVTPWKGVVRFGKKGKLAPSVHDTFHVSNLKKCLADASLHVPLEEIKVDKTLCFVEEPVEIMN
ncbi:hypothetical protein Tco_0695608 [Tanacetum coccineum]